MITILKGLKQFGLQIFSLTPSDSWPFYVLSNKIDSIAIPVLLAAENVNCEQMHSELCHIIHYHTSFGAKMACHLKADSTLVVPFNPR